MRSLRRSCCARADICKRSLPFDSASAQARSSASAARTLIGPSRSVRAFLPVWRQRLPLKRFCTQSRNPAAFLRLSALRPFWRWWAAWVADFAARSVSAKRAAITSASRIAPKTRKSARLRSCRASDRSSSRIGAKASRRVRNRRRATRALCTGSALSSAMRRVRLASTAAVRLSARCSKASVGGMSCGMVMWSAAASTMVSGVGGRDRCATRERHAG